MPSTIGAADPAEPSDDAPSDIAPNTAELDPVVRDEVATLHASIQAVAERLVDPA
jgi:hypothetical protein